MNNSEFDDESKEDGKVWTSYSDMFTTMAIIFLVMFVFALVKAGISTIKSNQATQVHKDEINGKLSKEDRSKAKNQELEIEKQLSKFTEYKSILNDKIEQLTSFAKEMEQSKGLIKNVISEQQRKDAIYNVLEEKFNKSLKKINSLERTRNAQIEYIKEQERKNRDLSDYYQIKISSKESSIKTLEKQLQQENQ